MADLDEHSGNEHPVYVKLRQQVLPWTESAKFLKKLWFYRLNMFFGYVTDITVALGAIGVTLPIMTILTQPLEKTNPVSVLSLLPRNSEWFYYITVIFVVMWTVLRVTFNREDGQKKAVLAKSCHQTMKQVEAKLHQVLAEPNPMPDIGKLVAEQIIPTVDRNIQEGSWPWSGPAVGVDQAVEAKLKYLSDKYSKLWSSVDSKDMRR